MRAWTLASTTSRSPVARFPRAPHASISTSSLGEQWMSRVRSGSAGRILSNTSSGRVDSQRLFSVAVTSPNMSESSSSSILKRVANTPSRNTRSRLVGPSSAMLPRAQISSLRRSNSTLSGSSGVSAADEISRQNMGIAPASTTTSGCPASAISPSTFMAANWSPMESESRSVPFRNSTKRGTTPAVLTTAPIGAFSTSVRDLRRLAARSRSPESVENNPATSVSRSSLSRVAIALDAKIRAPRSGSEEKCKTLRTNPSGSCSRPLRRTSFPRR
mmetsp:Transcript_15967/g.55176  ORF Transcript_15967/g.55176 Transcript_15967/m.55176 type:complete len:274 (-) Transcript_15967:133-954(-)